jgi:hypothetical protein
MNLVYKDYFEAHPPNRKADGVDLQAGMLLEAAFIVELPGCRYKATTYSD